MLLEKLAPADIVRLEYMEHMCQRGTPVDGGHGALCERSILLLKHFIPTFRHSLALHQEAQRNYDEKEQTYLFLKTSALAAIDQLSRTIRQQLDNGSFPRSCQALYGINGTEWLTNPDTDAAILAGGQQLIEGENRRVMSGGMALSEPRVFIVKVKLEQYAESFKLMGFARQNLERMSAKLAITQLEADELIADIARESGQGIVVARREKQETLAGLMM